jgi:hypothetical protein
MATPLFRGIEAAMLRHRSFPPESHTRAEAAGHEEFPGGAAVNAMEVWISRGDVEKAEGRNARWIELQVSAAKIVSRLSGVRGRNGKRVREYLLSSLSPAAQMQHAKQNLAIAPAPNGADSPVPLPLFAAAEATERARSSVPDELREQAELRFRAIEPLLDFLRLPGRGLPPFTLNGKKICNLSSLIEHLAATSENSKSQLWSWLAKFRKGGYAALPDRARSDQGRSHFFLDHPKAAAWVQQKYLGERIENAFLIHEALVREWGRRGRELRSERGSPPCYATVRAFLNSLPRPMRTLAHVGPEEYHAKHSPFVLRNPMRAMEWWIADHRVFDVLVRNTLFDELPRQKMYRLWLTAIYDWGSHRVVGFCFAPTPSSRTINSALRLAALQYGFPQNFYWDNGEDFKKVRRDLESIELGEETRALLKSERLAEITCALPKRPRSKPIESYFSRWSKRFDILWASEDAYVGNKPGACPETARAAQRRHALYVKGKRNTSPLPSDAEFALAAIQWIDEYNATRLESLDFRSPNQVMDEQFAPASRPQVNPRALDVLFSERAKRTVLQGGCVELDRMRYEPTDAGLFPLDVRQGRQILVLRDPYNLGEAVALDPETHEFVGELVVQLPIDQSPNGHITRDQIKAAMRKERALKRGYADYLELLRNVATAQGWRSEKDLLLERAGLRENVRTGTDPRVLSAAPGARLLGASPAAPRRDGAALFLSDSPGLLDDFGPIEYQGDE